MSSLIITLRDSLGGSGSSSVCFWWWRSDTTVRYVKCCTNINSYNQLSLQLVFIISALQIKKQRWTMRWIFFFQAVSRCQAAIRTQHPNSGFLTLKSPYFPVTKKENPQNSTPHPPGNVRGQKKNVKEGGKDKGGRWKEELRRKMRRMGVRGKANVRRN